jgi:hypothetical protein
LHSWYTLIGRRCERLPHIRDISLGRKTGESQAAGLGRHK